jgi:hypothetical protein
MAADTTPIMVLKLEEPAHGVFRIPCLDSILIPTDGCDEEREQFFPGFSLMSYFLPGASRESPGNHPLTRGVKEKKKRLLNNIYYMVVRFTWGDFTPLFSAALFCNMGLGSLGSVSITEEAVETKFPEGDLSS